MKIPPETKPALLGACAGAIALATYGFGWGGWMTAGSAAQMAETQSTMEVVKVLAPICVSNFQQETDAAANLTEWATCSRRATAMWSCRWARI